MSDDNNGNITENDLTLAGSVATLMERTKIIMDAVDKVKHVLLEGNGVPAITVQVATLNEKVSHLEEEARGYRIPRNVWFGIIVSAIIGLAGIVVSLKHW